MPQLSLHSPVGDLTLSEEEGAIVSLDWGRVPAAVPGADLRQTPLLARAHLLLQNYFDGQHVDFTSVAMKPHGTTFQQRVWRALQAIPYGSVRTYGELALELGSAPRALGGACGANPIAILIPCHRVVSSQGLGGFSAEGGVATKVALLRLEGVML
ncbi:MAG: methylated-DNA--[protein]-cysteine S-methyltransferase [Alphaproteobacteria bacterium]|jgi:methylated-DNA-[protein]-cysteine S-methyltransferase|nr:methylated-DNA--[protein]-cysteine S-methyltransferase [Alphaproteobacteria bacterium]HJP20254.1 methylated-DNA--[protein]-cysteine S-methyltransferase [Alphaproteobacteria bacterium]